MPKRGSAVQTNIRIDRKLYDEAVELVPHIADQPEFRFVSLSITAVIQMALDRGLRSMREEFAPGKSD